MDRKIYCPRCRRYVMKYDGRRTVDLIGFCRNCNKRIIYRVASGETIIKDRALRNTSSGMTFL